MRACASQPPTRLSELASFGRLCATETYAPLSRRPPRFSLEPSAVLARAERKLCHLGVGKMGVKFSGTDHLSLGRYWYTPAAMCERRREGWFM